MVLLIIRANGNLSVFSPTSFHVSGSWSISPYVTAIRLISIVAIAKALFSIKG